jgi:hypothetical protein
MKRLYFGNILAMIAEQNIQGRFQNTHPTECQVYKLHRKDIFSCPTNGFMFEYDLSNGQHVFTHKTTAGDEILQADWDGLTRGKQMELISNLYTFFLRNRMTDASMDEFLSIISHSPI